MFLVSTLPRVCAAKVLRVSEETERSGVLSSEEAGCCGKEIRTGMMLDSTRDNVDELAAALDAGFALC